MAMNMLFMRRNSSRKVSWTFDSENDYEPTSCNAAVVDFLVH